MSEQTTEFDHLTFEAVLVFCECCSESGLRADKAYAIVPAHHDPACPVRRADAVSPPEGSAS